jgi:hypothetical protein
MVVPAILSYPPPRVSDFHMGEAIGIESPNVSFVRRKNSALSKQTTCVFEDVALSDWTICLIQGARLGTRKVWDGKPAGYRVRQAKPHLEGRLTLAR